MPTAYITSNSNTKHVFHEYSFKINNFRRHFQKKKVPLSQPEAGYFSTKHPRMKEASQTG